LQIIFETSLFSFLKDEDLFTSCEDYPLPNEYCLLPNEDLFTSCEDCFLLDEDLFTSYEDYLLPNEDLLTSCEDYLLLNKDLLTSCEVCLLLNEDKHLPHKSPPLYFYFGKGAASVSNLLPLQKLLITK